MRSLHISNADGRDAVVAAAPVIPRDATTWGFGGKPVEFRRYISVASGLTFEMLTDSIGDDLAQALIEGDAEIDMEHVGMRIAQTSTMLLTSQGQPMYASPHIVEITYDASGAETSRKEPTDTLATVTDEIPLSWTGRRMSKSDVVRQFVFRRSLQLHHVDGVTFDFLYAMAKDLHESDEMILMGAGANGKEPIILQLNGSAYRGFLEGRVDGDAFALLLHLSNMELKRPSKAAEVAE